MRFLLSLPLLILLLSACMESEKTTYQYDPEVNEEQRAVLNEAFREWEDAVGIEFVQAGEAENATIKILIDELPEEFYGWAHYVYETRFFLDQYEAVELLKTAWITLSPKLWEMDADVQKRFIIHELGHIFTKSPHSDQCPSTMNALPINCGTTFVDQASAEITSENINDGWLKRRRYMN